MEIRLNNTIQRDPELMSSKLDNEVVLLSINNGKYYKIDEVGAGIWEKIENPTKVDEICKMMAKEYEVDVEECQQDTFNFLQQLLKDNLISIIQ